MFREKENKKPFDQEISKIRQSKSELFLKDRILTLCMCAATERMNRIQSKIFSLDSPFDTRACIKSSVDNYLGTKL